MLIYQEREKIDCGILILFNSESFNGTSNEKVFGPTLTGFEEHGDFSTLRFVSHGKYTHIVSHIHLQVQL
jgi:hypothetical protein